MSEWPSINQQTTSADEVVEKRLTLGHCWQESKLVQPLWKPVWSFLKKLKMQLPSDPVIPLLGIYPKKPGTLIEKNIWTPMFIAVLFTIAKI